MQTLKNLNFEKLNLITNSLKLDSNSSYIKSYPEFINYFKKIIEIKKHHVVISSHFVYGWMPTIINLNLDNGEQVLKLLNLVKNEHLLNEPELEILKKAINNSLVGLSKLLHFINPKIYAIWDSRIYRYLTEKKTAYGIGTVGLYLDYLEGLKRIANTNGFTDFKNKISNAVGYEVSSNRAIELVMFEADKKNQLELKTKT